MLWVNNGTLMKYPRLSRVNNGSHIHLIFKEMEPLPILDAQLQTQDGGKCSNMRDNLLPTRKERSFTSRVMSMLKIETLKLKTRTMESTSNGILYTLMNGRVNQERESLTRSSVSTLIEPSMLFLNCQ